MLSITYTVGWCLLHVISMPDATQANCKAKFMPQLTNYLTFINSKTQMDQMHFLVTSMIEAPRNGHEPVLEEEDIDGVRATLVNVPHS